LALALLGSGSGPSGPPVAPPHLTNAKHKPPEEPFPQPGRRLPALSCPALDAANVRLLLNQLLLHNHAECHFIWPPARVSAWADLIRCTLHAARCTLHAAYYKKNMLCTARVGLAAVQGSRFCCPCRPVPHRVRGVLGCLNSLLRSRGETMAGCGCSSPRVPRDGSCGTREWHSVCTEYIQTSSALDAGQAAAARFGRPPPQRAGQLVPAGLREGLVRLRRGSAPRAGAHSRRSPSQPPQPLLQIALHADHAHRGRTQHGCIGGPALDASGQLWAPGCCVRGQPDSQHLKLLLPVHGRPT
jgi:hypothetical protein